MSAVLPARVVGIPCLVRATFSPDTSRLSGHPDLWHHEPSELDWELLDRRGRRALWLERKMLAHDRAALEHHIKRHLRTANHE